MTTDKELSLFLSQKMRDFAREERTEGPQLPYYLTHPEKQDIFRLLSLVKRSNGQSPWLVRGIEEARNEPDKDKMESESHPVKEREFPNNYRNTVYRVLTSAGFDVPEARYMSRAMAETSEDVVFLGEDVHLVFVLSKFMDDPILHQAVNNLPQYAFPGQSLNPPPSPTSFKSWALQALEGFFSQKKQISQPAYLAQMPITAQIHALQSFYNLVTAHQIVTEERCLLFIICDDLFKNVNPALKAALILDNFIKPANAMGQTSGKNQGQGLNILKGYVAWVQDIISTSQHREEVERRMKDTGSSFTHPVTQVLRDMVIRRHGM